MWQCAWRFSPSRAASVAIRMRTGWCFGSRVEGPLDLLALVLRGRPAEDRDPRLGPVGPGDRGRELVAEVPLRVLVLGEDDDPDVVPPGGSARGDAHPVLRQVRAHRLADPVDQPADPGVGQATARPRRSRSSRRAAASPRRSGPARSRWATSAIVAASIWASSSAVQLLLGERGPVVVGLEAVGRADPATGVLATGSGVGRPGPAPVASRRSGDGRGGSGRTPRSRRAAAAGAPRRARPPRPACVCSRPGAAPPAAPGTRSSRTERRSSGASGPAGRRCRPGGRPAWEIPRPPGGGPPSAGGPSRPRGASWGPARPGRTAAGRGSPAGPRSCSSGRYAAWPTGRAGARTARRCRGRPA